MGQKNATPPDDLQIVSCTLGKEQFGLEIGKVKKVIRFPYIDKPPYIPDYNKGIISFRDVSLPVIDFCSDGNDQASGFPLVVVVESNGSYFGLKTNQVNTVMTIPKDRISPPEPSSESNYPELIAGIARLEGNRNIFIMDLTKIAAKNYTEEITFRELITPC